MSMQASAWQKNILEFAKVMFVIIIGLLIGTVIIFFVSEEPGKAYNAILTGSLPKLFLSGDCGTLLSIFGEDCEWKWRRMSRFGIFLEDSITLALVGLAVAIPFRAWQISLGADGQLFMGALASGFVSIYVPLPPYALLPLAFLVAMLAGFAWGYLPGIMKAKAGANEIVTTLMLNVIAIQIFSYAILHLIRDPNAGFIVSHWFQDGAKLEPLINRTSVTWMILIAPVICAIGYYVMSRTTVGYEIRVVGFNTNFARQMGMPVDRTIALSMAFGGAVAGVAGFHIANALLHRLPIDFPVALGFEGIVVALIARNDPRWIVPAALFYGYLRAGAQVMERTTDVSREMVLVVQAIIILLIISEKLLPRLAQLFRLKGRSA